MYAFFLEIFEFHLLAPGRGRKFAPPSITCQGSGSSILWPVHRDGMDGLRSGRSRPAARAGSNRWKRSHADAAQGNVQRAGRSLRRIQIVGDRQIAITRSRRGGGEGHIERAVRSRVRRASAVIGLREVAGSLHLHRAKVVLHQDHQRLRDAANAERLRREGKRTVRGYESGGRRNP